jgi:hypothetical protein
VHEQTCCHALAALYHCGINLQDECYHLIPTWFHLVSILAAYDYIEIGQNEWGEDITIYPGLRAIDITRLVDDIVDNTMGVGDLYNYSWSWGPTTNTCICSKYHLRDTSVEEMVQSDKAVATN